THKTYVFSILPDEYDVCYEPNKYIMCFSKIIYSAPVSPLVQRTRINTKYATIVALPSTLALDPARLHLPENEEQPIDPFYAFVYVSDREEWLVIPNVATLVDGNPDNNFLTDAVRFNPDG